MITAALELKDDRATLMRLRPVLHAERAERLNLDNFKFARGPGVAESFASTNIGKLIQSS